MKASAHVKNRYILKNGMAIDAPGVLAKIKECGNPGQKKIRGRRREPPEPNTECGNCAIGESCMGGRQTNLRLDRTTGTKGAGASIGSTRGGEKG